MATSLTKRGLLAASDKLILAARPALEVIKDFTLDLSDDAVKPGTGVVVDVVTSTAENFVKATNNYKHATGTVKPVVVPVDIRKKSTFSLDDVDAIDDETSFLWDKFGPAAGRAVGGAIIQGVTGLLTRTARETATHTLGGTTLADFFAMRAFIEKQGIDPSTVVALLEPTTYSNLCSVLNAGIVGDGSVVRGAIIGAALGFKSVYSAPTISTDSAAASDGKGKGFLVPENAIAIANRVVKPIKGVVGGTIEYGTFTDEVSGITLSERVVYDSGDGECFWTSEGLFGAKLTKLDASGNATGAPGYYQIVVS